VLALAVILACAAPPASGAAPGNPEVTPEVQKYLRAAVVLYESLEFERVLEVLGEAHKVAVGTTDDVSISLLEGIILFDLRRVPESETAFERALLLNPDAELPLKVSPKTAEGFEAVRARVRAKLAKATPSSAAPAPPAPGVAAPAPVPPSPPVLATAPPAAEVSKGSSGGPPLLATGLIAGGVLAAGVGTYMSVSALTYNQNKLAESWQQAASERQRSTEVLVAGESLIVVGAAAALAGAGILVFGRSSSVAVAPTLNGVTLAGTY
jgi:hypothetical protein